MEVAERSGLEDQSIRLEDATGVDRHEFITSDCDYPLTIEIPWDYVAATRRFLVKGVAKTTTVPGFRRGKAPLVVLNSHYHRELLDLLSETFIPKHLLEEIRKRDVRVASGPVIDDVRFVEGQPLRVQARFEVFPEFELGEYRNLKIRSCVPEVTEERVDEAIEALRAEHATYQYIDHRPARDGDFVTVRLNLLSSDGTPTGEPHTTMVEIGNERISIRPGDAVRGMRPGGKAEFEAAIPPDQGDPDSSMVRGFLAEVLQVATRELPAVDDEFVKDVDDSLEGVDALRERIRESLEKRNEDLNARYQRDQVTVCLANAHPFLLPERYLRERLRQAIEDERVSGDLADSSVAEWLAVELLDTRGALVLDRIAEVENIAVSRVELEAAVQRFAESQQLNSREEQDELATRPGVLNRMYVEMRREKAAQLVISEAEVTEVTESELRLEVDPYGILGADLSD